MNQEGFVFLAATVTDYPNAFPLPAGGVTLSGRLAGRR
jgi:hypothetical protein